MFENKTLRDVCCINQGIVSGADYVSEKHLSKYMINANKHDGIFVLDNCNCVDSEVLEQVENDENESTVLKSFYKNSDISKYSTLEQTSKRILFLGKDIANEKALSTKYPIIAQHLANYKQILVDKRISLHEKPTQWFTLNRGTSHPEVFSKRKIVCPQRSKSNTFGYNECEWYAASDVFFITNSEEGYDIKYILALLNSKLYYVWLYNKGKRKGETLELTATPLSEIPLKRPNSEEERLIVSKVDDILSAKRINKEADTSVLENKIDFLVYHLYDLTYDEVLVVDPNPPFSREEYDAYQVEQ